jgi:hypothetical protein
MEFQFENLTFTFQEKEVQQGAIRFPSLVIKILKEKPIKSNSDS